MDQATKRKVLCVVGARPNFMKIAPILRAMASRAPGLLPRLVHTGQHYNYAMNESFFHQLGIPTPDISLEVGSGSHAVQTAEIMRRFEPVVEQERPDAVLVVGDVNSTMACALVAAKMNVKIVHVEAGLRSRDRTMPEEINRLVTDRLSDRLYVTEREATENLLSEGVEPDRIVFTGNVMIDTLLQSLPQAVSASRTLHGAAAPDLFTDRYALLTLHRPSNVDDPATLVRLAQTLEQVANRIPLVFPMHPRTRAKMEHAGLKSFLEHPRVLVLPPVSYFEMLGLLKSARVVLTDSGGVQEETTALGVPCLTLRESTERPITATDGTNTIVGVASSAILDAVDSVLRTGGKAGRQPEFWDGHAAERVVDDLSFWLGARTH